MSDKFETILVVIQEHKDDLCSFAAKANRRLELAKAELSKWTQAVDDIGYEIVALEDGTTEANAAIAQLKGGDDAIDQLVAERQRL